MKINKHIVIVRSTIKNLSSMSQFSCDALKITLSKHYRKVSVHIVNNINDLETLVIINPDLAFMGMQSIPNIMDYSTNILLAQYLNDNNIATTGSGADSHILEHSKSLAKQRILDTGLATSAYFVARQNTPILEAENILKFPLFVKPLDMGGGSGIDSMSVVHDFTQLLNKVDFISTEFATDSLVEEYLDGREFSVAILQKEDSDEYLSMPLELIAPEDEFGSRILSGTVKDQDTETFSSVIDLTLKRKLSDFAIEIFKSLGARDYGRIDIRLNSAGIPQFLEANLIPSIIEGFGNFPKACLLNENLDYETIILRIASLAFARKVAETEVIVNTSLQPLAI